MAVVSECMYCHAPIDATVYDGVCLSCTADLLVILGSGAIERRLRIEKRKGSDAALRKAIKEARKKRNEVDRRYSGRAGKVST